MVLGPPGSGKGTLASQLHGRFGITHLSTGELFRHEMKGKTPLGRSVEGYVANGQLVPDDLVVRVMTRRMTPAFLRRGFVLDGFPRTVAQAVGLDQFLKRRRLPLNGAVALTCPESLLVRRLTGRQVCPKCGAIYHVVRMPPKRKSICDGCGARLMTRQDDRVATIRKRLVIDREQSRPLLHYYRQERLLHTLNGNGSNERVLERAMGLFQRVGWRDAAAHAGSAT